MADFKPKLIEKLRSSGIDLKNARALKMDLITPTECKASGMPAYWGIKIPYFGLNGRPTDFYRVRYLEEVKPEGFAAQLEGAKVLRYIQPAGTVNEPYYPPQVDWTDVAVMPDISSMEEEEAAETLSSKYIMITEGEFKAAAGCIAGINTIGLGGVWVFKASKSLLDFLPGLDLIDWRGRPVCICFDSDINRPDKAAIRHAESSLAETLLRRGAVVSLARIPAGEEGQKYGVDDYIVEFGSEAFINDVLGNTLDFAPSRVLHKINRSYAYIRRSARYFDVEQRSLRTMADLLNGPLANVKLMEEIGEEKFRIVPAGKRWVEWEQRQEFNDLEYEPGRPSITAEGNFNTWEGWGCSPLEGDVSLWHKLLDQIFGSAKFDDERLWFERWCAYPIQHPGTKMATATLLWSTGEGLGKSLLGTFLRAIYGRNASELNEEVLQRPFNEWMRYKQFIVFDDITPNESRQFGGKVRTMITQSTVSVNMKNMSAFELRDCINYLFTSNHSDAIPMGDNDRRMFVHEVTSPRLNERLTTRLVEWLKNSGPSALMYHLMNLDLGDFNPYAPAMMTESKEDMIKDAKPVLASWIRERIVEDPEWFARKVKVPGELLPFRVLFDQYRKEHPASTVSPNKFSRELKTAGLFKPTKSPVIIGDDQTVLYAIKNLDRWRSCAHSDVVTYYADLLKHNDPSIKYGKKY